MSYSVSVQCHKEQEYGQEQEQEQEHEQEEIKFERAKDRKVSKFIIRKYREFLKETLQSHTDHTEQQITLQKCYIWKPITLISEQNQ